MIFRHVIIVEMKDDFSPLNNRVNSHANAIKQLEDQFGQLLAQFEPTIFEGG